MESSLNLKKRKISQLSGENDGSNESEFELIKTENAKLRDLIVKQAVKINELESNKSNDDESNENMKAEMDRLKEVEAKLQEKFKEGELKMVNEVGKLKSIIDEKDEEARLKIEYRDNRIAELEEQISVLQDVKVDFVNKNDDLAEEREAFQLKNNEMKLQVDQLKQKNAEWETQAKEDRQKTDDSKKEISDLKEQLSIKEDDLEKHEKDKKEFEAKINALSLQVDNLTRKNAALKAEAEKARKVMDVKDKELNELKKQLSSSTADADEEITVSVPPESTDNQAHCNNEDESTQASLVPAKKDRRILIEQFPEWMKEVVSRRFPYTAQLGDRVVYFPQGHRNFIKECKKQNILKRNMVVVVEINSYKFAIIENIEYTMVPYRSKILTLALTDQNGIRTNKKIKLHHHDLDNVPDFIVLRQFYDNSVTYDFEAGDRIEAIIDDKWWIGTVEERIFETQGNYNGSQLNSVVIKWDAEPNTEKLSPWELLPLTPGRCNGIIATSEDHELFDAYTVEIEHWPLPSGGPNVGGNAELARNYFLNKLVAAIQQLKHVQGVSSFQHPVNLRQFPDYAEIVAYPIDLQTISERITNKYYRTLLYLKKDIQMIAVNANKFNQPSCEIARDSKRLVQTLFHILDSVTPPNATEYFHSLKETSPSKLTAWKQNLF